MGAIFISYRRSDAEGEAGHLYKDLCERFGKEAVFIDVAGIAKGRDFRRIVDDRLASCDVFLAIIGKDWLEATDDEGRRRLDKLDDYVRLETVAALRRDIPVIPVLVQGARMPRAEDLPRDLQDLAYRNGTELTHARWDSDVRELIKALAPCVKDVSGSAHPVSAWNVKVFNFKNYDGRLEREHVGERFSGFILDALIQLDLAAGGIDATEPKYIPMRSPEPSVDWNEYAEFMPFVGIIGFVAPAGAERFHTSIRVAAITGPARVETRRVDQIECGFDTPAMLRAAQEVAARIRDEINRLSQRAGAAAPPIHPAQ